LIAISIRNPLASLVITGHVRNVSLDVYVETCSYALIHVANDRIRDTRDMDDPEVHGDVRNALIGIAKVSQVILPGRSAKAVWLFEKTIVFRTPVPVESPYGLFDYDESTLTHEIDTAMTPAQAMATFEHHANPDSIHPRRADGWVGD